MSRIQALDEITSCLGQPSLLRWVDAPYGAVAAVARFRHRGASVHLSASGTFRLILHLNNSQVNRQQGSGVPSFELASVGTISPLFTSLPERIQILGAADTVHILFSRELTNVLRASPAQWERSQLRSFLQIASAQALVAISLSGTDLRLENIISSIASEIVHTAGSPQQRRGGLSPKVSRKVRSLLEDRVSSGVSVPQLAQAAGISLHHFIKAFRTAEGLTPHALLLHKRVEQSLALLLSYNISIQEIAISLGFASPSHFTSTFRKLVGVTPRTVQQAARACYGPQ